MGIQEPQDSRLRARGAPEALLGQGGRRKAAGMEGMEGGEGGEGMEGGWAREGERGIGN